LHFYKLFEKIHPELLSPDEKSSELRKKKQKSRLVRQKSSSISSFPKFQESIKFCTDKKKEIGEGIYDVFEVTPEEEKQVEKAERNKSDSGSSLVSSPLRSPEKSTDTPHIIHLPPFDQPSDEQFFMK
jgi:hypothetical protein